MTDVMTKKEKEKNIFNPEAWTSSGGRWVIPQHILLRLLFNYIPD